VAIASRLTPEVRPVLPVMTEEGRAEVSKMLEKLSSGGILQAVTTSSLSYQTVGIDPHEGTREGARAAWGFVIDAPFGIEAAVPLMRAWNIRAAAMAEFAQVVGAKYRRELEAI
jgi:hypothetical protein